ncbi:integrase [Lasius niger]|uniref:Integrase n=1 Tax=Lasius niger TaxID=67767 RepID=A0A0J7KGM1_LASNI|nr:integrase [Lasius niger]
MLSAGLFSAQPQLQRPQSTFLIKSQWITISTIFSLNSAFKKRFPHQPPVWKKRSARLISRPLIHETALGATSYGSHSNRQRVNSVIQGQPLNVVCDASYGALNGQSIPHSSLLIHF